MEHKIYSKIYNLFKFIISLMINVLIFGHKVSFIKELQLYYVLRLEVSNDWKTHPNAFFVSSIIVRNLSPYVIEVQTGSLVLELKTSIGDFYRTTHALTRMQ